MSALLAPLGTPAMLAPPVCPLQQLDANQLAALVQWAQLATR